MSKRIVILVKGKSTFEDDEYTNLDYLDEDIKLISKTLNYYGQWELSEIIELKNPEDIKKALISYAKYDEIIFYYTGHGRVDVDTAEFNLVGEDRNISLEKVFRDCSDELKKCTLTLIIDACRSGYFIDEAHKPRLDYEILTATNYGNAFPKVDENISFFTNLLCEYIRNNASEGKEIYLKDIGKSIYEDSKKSFEDIDQKKQPVQYYFPERLNSKDKSVIANYGDIKTEQPQEDKKLFLTIEIVHHYDNMYHMHTWEEWENPSGEIVLRNTSPSDDSYNKEEIPSRIDEFRRSKYPHIKIHDIFLTLILPSELMMENINFWKLENGVLLGSEYTILLRGRERFVTEGKNKGRKYYDIQKWNDNWNEYILKKDDCIDVTCCTITSNDDEQEITSTEVAQTPFALMHYNPTPDSFKNLYKSGFPIIMWVNGCKDFTKFEEIFSKSDYKKIKLGDLHDKLYKFKPRHTGIGRDASIMLIYDNPELLPYDEKASKLTNPKGE